jgi:hypothetical protein
MFTFTCNEKDCANENVEYNVPGNSPVVECGGCKETLSGTNERPDPVIPERNFGLPEQN